MGSLGRRTRRPASTFAQYPRGGTGIFRRRQVLANPRPDKPHSVGELAGCAWRAIRLYLLAAFDSMAIQPGAVGFIQTSGELLRYHPHIHVLLADGALLPDGSFRHLLYFNTEHVQRLFRAEVFRLLLGRGKISQEKDCESSEDPTADPSEDEDPDGWKKRRRISWAQLIRKVFEVDPMLCSFCGAKLEVLSFTLNLGTIRKFLTSIDCPSQELSLQVTLRHATSSCSGPADAEGEPGLLGEG